MGCGRLPSPRLRHEAARARLHAGRGAGGAGHHGHGAGRRAEGRWRADARGFRFEGLPASTLPTQWLDAGTGVRGPATLQLGPEPLIGPQQVLLVHQAHPERTLRVATDGLRPFTVQALP